MQGEHDHFKVYCDGSFRDGMMGFAAYCPFNRDTLVGRFAGGSVLQAELEAIYLGLTYATTIMRPGDQLSILTDSQAAIATIGDGYSPGRGRWVAHTLRRIEVLSARYPHLDPEYVWVPRRLNSHSDRLSRIIAWSL